MASGQNFTYSAAQLRGTYLTDAAITLQYAIVKAATDGDVQTAGSGEQVFGVAQDVYGSGVDASVVNSGPTVARIASGSINAGVYVKAAANGYVTLATTADIAIGKTLAAASGTNAQVPIYFFGHDVTAP